MINVVVADGTNDYTVSNFVESMSESVLTLQINNSYQHVLIIGYERVRRFLSRRVSLTAFSFARLRKSMRNASRV